MNNNGRVIKSDINCIKANKFNIKAPINKSKNINGRNSRIVIIHPLYMKIDTYLKIYVL